MTRCNHIEKLRSQRIRLEAFEAWIRYRLDAALAGKSGEGGNMFSQSC